MAEVDGLCSLRLREQCEWEGALYTAAVAVEPVPALSGAGRGARALRSGHLSALVCCQHSARRALTTYLLPPSPPHPLSHLAVMSANETWEAELMVHATLDEATRLAEKAATAYGDGNYQGGWRLRGLLHLLCVCLGRRARPRLQLCPTHRPPASMPTLRYADASGITRDAQLGDGATTTAKSAWAGAGGGTRRLLVSAGSHLLRLLPFGPGRRLQQDVLAGGGADIMAALYDPSLAMGGGATTVGAELPVPAVDALALPPPTDVLVLGYPTSDVSTQDFFVRWVRVAGWWLGAALGAVQAQHRASLRAEG